MPIAEIPTLIANEIHPPSEQEGEFKQAQRHLAKQEWKREVNEAILADEMPMVNPATLLSVNPQVTWLPDGCTTINALLQFLLNRGIRVEMNAGGGEFRSSYDSVFPNGVSWADVRFHKSLKAVAAGFESPEPRNVSDSNELRRQAIVQTPEIVLPVGKTYVTVEEIPQLIASVLYPEAHDRRAITVSYLIKTKHVAQGGRDLGCPLSDDD